MVSVDVKYHVYLLTTTWFSVCGGRSGEVPAERGGSGGAGAVVGVHHLDHRLLHGQSRRLPHLQHGSGAHQQRLRPGRAVASPAAGQERHQPLHPL